MRPAGVAGCGGGVCACIQVRAHRHNVLVCGATPPLDRAATLPALLQRQGYTTALVGKFHFPEQACLQNRNVANKGTGPDARPLGWDR